jgi:hypothetical protein
MVVMKRLPGEVGRYFFTGTRFPQKAYCSK